MTDSETDTAYIPIIDTGHALVAEGSPDQLRALTTGVAGLHGERADEAPGMIRRFCDTLDVDYELIDAKDSSQTDPIFEDIHDHD